MTGARTHSHSDLSSVALPADESVATVASPAAVATHNPVCDDADLEAAISALEISWLRAGIIMNAITLRSVAVSETVSKSTSTVGA
jgi:hypothetical protein